MTLPVLVPTAKNRALWPGIWVEEEVSRWSDGVANGDEKFEVPLTVLKGSSSTVNKAYVDMSIAVVLISIFG
tara:strand:- start:654 stop:869 length:216 start_codon:yes stop_codon:yes gene_type:complete